jgi:ABC-type antimicrobial peptide transport system permease subunit
VLIGTGLALGLITASALSRFLANQLYGVGPTVPLVYTGVAVVTMTVGLDACYLPARQAARIDPMKTLRLE